MEENNFIRQYRNHRLGITEDLDFDDDFDVRNTQAELAKEFSKHLRMGRDPIVDGNVIYLIHEDFTTWDGYHDEEVEVPLGIFGIIEITPSEITYSEPSLATIEDVSEIGKKPLHYFEPRLIHSSTSVEDFIRYIEGFLYGGDWILADKNEEDKQRILDLWNQLLNAA